MPIPQPPIAFVPRGFPFLSLTRTQFISRGLNSAQQAPCTSEEPIVGIASVSSSAVTDKGKEAN